jgi:hypothetical protein
MAREIIINMFADGQTVSNAPDLYTQYLITGGGV